jgi:hypothetical protein
VEYHALCQAGEIAHVVGPCDALIAWLTANGYVKAEAFPNYRQPATGREA